MSEKLIILLLVVGGVVVWAVLAYNQLVELRNRFQNAFAQIDVQLKRRYELIPNLVGKRQSLYGPRARRITGSHSRA